MRRYREAASPRLEIAVSGIPWASKDAIHVSCPSPMGPLHRGLDSTASISVRVMPYLAIRVRWFGEPR